MRLMIPTDACDQVGLRPVIAAEDFARILEEIPGLPVADDSNWNKRYRENMLRIKSGGLLEVAGVVKSLLWREMRFGLSNGERKMLHSAKQILLSELMLSQELSYDEVEKQLYDVLG